MSNPVAPKSSDTRATENGLDSIFTPAPQSSTVYQKVEVIAPMRRGRPIVKSKPVVEATHANSDLLFTSTAPATAANKGKNDSPPEESDLLSREAAAGFGDAFLSPSPQATSFQAPQRKSNEFLEPSVTSSNFPSQSRPIVSTIVPRQDLKPAVSSAFEDLVPSRKLNPPKTLNEIRQDLINVNRTPAGLTIGSPKFSDDFHPSLAALNSFTHRRMPQSKQNAIARTGNISQKTGPGAFPLRDQQAAHYGNPSLTQKTGPTPSSGPPAVSPKAIPTMSDWLKKDQIQMMSNPSPGTLTAEKVVKPDSGHPVLQLNLNQADKPKSMKPTRSEGSIKSKLNPALRSDASQSLLISDAAVAISNPNKNFRGPPLEASESSDSDEAPEDPEGHKGYRGPGQYTRSLAQDPVPKPGAQIGFVESSKRMAEKKPEHTSPAYENSVKPPSPIEIRHISPTTTSNTAQSSSEAMTEEDEETRLQRRAAIAKFAPAAQASSPQLKESDQVARDPFSSRAQSRSTSPEPKPLASTTNRPTRRSVDPPLRAPKPQSLKSAAAINNLVSRYENLSSDASNSSSAPITSPVTGFNKRVSSFKPTNTTILTNDKSSNREVATTPSSLAHIPVKSLGPGVLNRSRDLNAKGSAESEDERFTSVNDMKSKWESGAIKSSTNSQPRQPRTDYGQK